MPPGGVASQFLAILQHDAKAARGRLLLGLVLAMAFAVPAYFLYPWQGLLLHAIACLAGAGVGVVFAGRQAKAFERSIRGSWNQWMKYAIAAESVAEVNRKVRGRPGRNLPYLYGALLFVSWALEAGVLVLAFVRSGPLEFGLVAPAILLNGLVAGFLMGHGRVLWRWLADFRVSVAEMVDSGEIGVWGML